MGRVAELGSLCSSLLHRNPADFHRHRHRQSPRTDFEREAAAGVLLVEDLCQVDVVPVLPAAAALVDQARSVQVGEVVAERVVRDLRAGGVVWWNPDCFGHVTAGCRSFAESFWSALVLQVHKFLTGCDGGARLALSRCCAAARVGRGIGLSREGCE